MTTARPPFIPLVVAAGAWLLYLVPGVAGDFGVFIDELYYVSCAKRLAWGYVDHPPLSIAVLRGALTVFGDSIYALRVPAATIGALVVVLTGWIAARLGASPFGQAMACAAVVSAPLLQVLFGFYSMNALELLLWLGLGAVALEIERTANARLWLAFGALAGLALLTKHTVTTYAAGLGIAMAMTPARRHLVSPWLWAGAGLAAAIALANVDWQHTHGWPSLEFYRNAALYKNNPASPVEVVVQQVLFMSPGVLPVTVAGLVFLWRRRQHGDLRHLALQFAVMLALLVWSAQSRPDRLAGLYPLLFACGGVLAGEWAARRPWVRWALPVWLLAWGLLLAPVGTPLLSPQATSDHLARLGIVIQTERGEGKRTPLPQHFADRIGWPKLVDDVAAVRDALPPADRERVVFFAQSYGQASALDWLGAPRGLNRVHAIQNTWHMWGPPAENPQVAIVLGDRRTRLEELFAEVTEAGRHQCGACMPWRNNMPIWVVRGPKVDIRTEWKDWKHYE
jgi:hypothetical protein